jgi:hypothetical protein
MICVCGHGIESHKDEEIDEGIAYTACEECSCEEYYEVDMGEDIESELEEE